MTQSQIVFVVIYSVSGIRVRALIAHWWDFNISIVNFRPVEHWAAELNSKRFEASAPCRKSAKFKTNGPNDAANWASVALAERCITTWSKAKADTWLCHASIWGWLTHWKSRYRGGAQSDYKRSNRGGDNSWPPKSQRFRGGGVRSERWKNAHLTRRAYERSLFHGKTHNRINLPTVGDWERLIYRTLRAFIFVEAPWLSNSSAL